MRIGFKYLARSTFGERRILRQLYLRSLVVLGALFCYYLGVTLVQVPQDAQWTFFVLVFSGYIALGFLFGFLFGRRILISVGLVFALGFLGAALSIFLYRVIVSQYDFSMITQDSASLFAAAFFISIAVAAGDFINTVFAWIVRRRSGKDKSVRKRRSNEDRPQSAGLV